MINKDYENYGKPFHYLLSPSNWLDLDSLMAVIMDEGVRALINLGKFLRILKKMEF